MISNMIEKHNYKAQDFKTKFKTGDLSKPLKYL